YLVLGVAQLGLLLYFVPSVLISPPGSWLFDIPLRIVGTVHAAYLAGRRSATKPLPVYSRWYSLVGISLAFPSASLAIRSFLYQPFTIPSGAMEPSVNIGDYLFVEKFAYGYSRASFPFRGWPVGGFSHGRLFDSVPERGDVVVFKMPNPD